MKCVLSSVKRGSVGCSACAVGAIRCLLIHGPFLFEVLIPLTGGSQEGCLELKSPTTITGGEREEPARGMAALHMWLVNLDMSACVALHAMYAPPMMMGDVSKGDETQTNPSIVRVCLGRYGVLCGMLCNGMNVHDL